MDHGKCNHTWVIHLSHHNTIPTLLEQCAQNRRITLRSLPTRGQSTSRNDFILEQTCGRRYSCPPKTLQSLVRDKSPLRLRSTTVY